MAAEEDNHDGEQQGCHGRVSPVALGDAVVDQSGPDRKIIITLLLIFLVSLSLPGQALNLTRKQVDLKKIK